MQHARRTFVIIVVTTNTAVCDTCLPCMLLHNIIALHRYSQYTAARGQLMMAGQIGLDPPIMKLHPTVVAETQASLRSAHAVMSVGGCANLAQVSGHCPHPRAREGVTLCHHYCLSS